MQRRRDTLFADKLRIQLAEQKREHDALMASGEVSRIGKA